MRYKCSTRRSSPLASSLRNASDAENTRRDGLIHLRIDFEIGSH
jgi:hypothetical protein